MIQKIKCTVKFVTPGFVGDADQKGTWRSPPFKALLRQWWRIVVARQFDYNHKRLRDEEGKLFGHAWLQNTQGKTWALQGQVRLKLERWRYGMLKAWPEDPKVEHPEVDSPKIGSHLYLGYGSLNFQKKKGTVLKNNNPAISPSVETSGLFIAFPEKEKEKLIQVLQLIHWFGSMGGRSRNGWGSLALSECEGGEIQPAEYLLEGHAPSMLLDQARLFEDCMDRDWPHAIGRNADERLLIWKTKKSFKSWSEAMKELARVKIAFRVVCTIATNRDLQYPRLEERHILSYPVTNHGVDGWVKKDTRGKFETEKQNKLKQEERLANQIRFKLLHLKSNEFVGVAYHLPHKLPDSLKTKLSERDKQMVTRQWQIEIWKKVHGILDKEMNRIERAPQ
jgi:CRISPR-associated protein Cmr1